MSKRCYCTACGESFSTEANFALHQGAIAGCFEGAPKLDGTPRLVKDSKGVWRSPPRETPWSAVAAMGTA